MEAVTKSIRERTPVRSSQTTRLLSGEVYSGYEDPTPEYVVNQRRNEAVAIWSVMSSGANRHQYIGETGVKYTAFSIEELMTMSTPGMEEQSDE